MLTQPDNVGIPESFPDKRFIKVPLCAQETPYTCGEACIQSILACYGIIYRQDELSEFLKQKPIYGTDYRDILNFMEMLGFQASYQVNMNIPLIKDHIKQGTPLILMLQAWKEDAIDYTYDWRDSHYVIACGYDSTRILFMDPWTIGNYTFLLNNELMKRWHTTDFEGKHYHYSGIVIKQVNVPFLFNSKRIKHMG